MRQCTSWLREDLSKSYVAVGLVGRSLDPYLSPRRTYTVAVTNSVALPEGAMLYLFRLPWYYMILP